MELEAAEKGGAGRPKQMNLFFLTWPIFLEMFLFMLMGIADTFMLAAISDNAVSGVGAANQFIHIAILVLEVIGNGASIVVAQYIGSKKLLEAAKISAHAITLNFIAGLIVSFVFLAFNGIMLQMLNLQGDILEYAKSYLAIVGGGIFLQALINSLSAIVRVNGFTREAMFVSLGMNIIHITCNYVLIFGKLGFPALGVEGAAISSVFSRFVALLVFLWLLYRVTEVRIQLAYYIKLSKEYVGKILKIGIPSALEQVMYQSCQIVFLFYVTFLGAESMAARQYANNISQFIYIFAFAIGLGTCIIIGRMIGAGRMDDAYRRVITSAKWSICMTLVMVALVMIFREQLMNMFTGDPEVVRLGANVLLLSIVLETGRTFNIIFVNSLRAAGDAKFPLWVGIFTMVLMSLSLGYLFVFVLDMGLAGIWLAIASDEWARAVIMYLRWRSRKWERHSLVKPDTVQTAAVH